MVYPSRVSVQCAICNMKMQRKSLKLHFSRRHPTLKPREMLISQDEIRAYLMDGAPGMASAEMEETPHTSSNEEMEEQEEGNSREGAPNNEAESLLERINWFVTNQRMNQNKTLQDKLDQVIDILHILHNNIEPKEMPPLKKKIERPNTVIRSVDELLVSYKDFLIVDRDKKLFYCKFCRDAALECKFGVFTYDFEVEDFDGKNMSSSFRNLKSRIRTHVDSAIHKKNINPSPKADKGDVSQPIEKRIIRTAYFIIKKSLPRKLFADLISLNTLSGLQMGNINHSCAMVNKTRIHFAKYIRTSIQQHVSSVPCVSLVAGKFKTRRGMLEIIGLHTVLPEAPVGKMMQCVVLGSPKLKHQDRDCTASSWIKVAQEFGLTAFNLAAIGVNDAIFEMGVPDLFSRMLAGAESRSVPAVCNPAFVLELTWKKVKSTFWIANIIQIIQHVSKFSSKPKVLSELRTVAQNTDSTFLQPVLFDETRLCTNSLTSIKIFLNNLPIYRSIVESYFNQGNIKNDAIMERFRLSPYEVEIESSALHDILHCLCKCAESLHSMQILPWEKSEAFSSLDSELQEMALFMPKVVNVLGESNDTMIKQEGPSAAWIKLKNFEITPEFAASIEDLLVNLLLLRNSELEKDVCSNIASSWNGVITAHSNTMKLLADLRYLRDIANNEDLVQKMQNAQMELIAVNIIPAIELPQEAFVEAVKALQSLPPEARENQCIFKELWNQSKEIPSLRDYMNLVTRLWLTFPSESIVDSLGNVLKDVFQSHRNLDLVNAEKELLIKWNGPSLSHCDGMIADTQKKLKLRAWKECTKTGKKSKTVQKSSIAEPLDYLYKRQE